MMRNFRMTCLGLGAFTALAFGRLAGAAPAADKPVIVFDTTAGTIEVELDPDKAPITVKNFLKYVEAGHYTNLVFHRVIPDFMIQGGGLDQDLNDHSQGAKGIKNESNNGLSNLRGTIAMARTGQPDSATSQFYINVADNGRRGLDGGQRPTGYTVFGKVVAGMDVVDAIVKTPTTSKRSPEGQPFEDVPVKPVVIKSAKRKVKA